MGSNAFIVAKKSKEYIWLGKRFYQDREEFKDIELSDIQERRNALHKFVDEHQGEDLIYGFAHGISEIYEHYLDIPFDYYYYNSLNPDLYKELDYSMES